MLVTLVGLVIVVVAVIFVAWPLLTPDPSEEPAVERSEASALRKEKEAALEAISEIDFDHRVGKLSDQDHASLRSTLEKRAFDALRALDEADRNEPALRAIAGQGTAPRDDGAAGSCPGCGTRFKRDSRFCVSCGNDLPKSEGGRSRRRAKS